MSHSPDEPPIRVRPHRQKTLTSDQWGIHNVPTMLSDFKRHTSHAGLTVNTSLTGTFTDEMPTAGPFTAQPEDPASFLSSIPSLISLPTGLMAAEYMAATTGAPVSTVMLVSGLLLFMSGLFGMLETRKLFVSTKTERKSTFIMTISIICLLIANCTIGCMKTTIFTMISLNLGKPSSKTVWPCLLPLLVVFTYDLGKGSVPMTGSSLLAVPALQTSFLSIIVGYTSLAVSCYGNALPNPSSISVEVAFLSGTFLIVPGLFLHTPSLNALVLIAISGWAIGVFVLAKRDLCPSRFNAVIGAAISTALECLLREASPWAILLSAVTIAFPVNGRTRTETSTNHSGSNAWGILDSILAHDDTRNIFYFLLLNFTFMLVQLLYSLLSHSLGLLSDSIHMFFDCLALLVGLVASILSKFPPSTRFPYGLNKVETVSGFTNGCLLVGISAGVITEAIERINNPIELERTAELLVVSVLGLLVNLVGIFAFHHGHDHGGHGHSHGGHSHGHSHGGHGQDHTHSHAHGDDHSHGHSHGHSHAHSHDHSHDHSDANSHDHSEHGHHSNDHSHDSHLHSHENHHDHSCHDHSSHGHHSHKNENMYGIFLHIMADTLGSVGVIVSTILIKYTGWHGFDPLASIFIAVLIFLSAVPLISSSARTLLLSLDDHQEYQLRDILNEISVISGLASYTVPKFWSDAGKIQGVIHVQYHKEANSTVVRDKVDNKLKEHGIDGVFIQMERDGTPCWCKG